jgi:hypothetical protein
MRRELARPSLSDRATRSGPVARGAAQGQAGRRHRNCRARNAFLTGVGGPGGCDSGSTLDGHDLRGAGGDIPAVPLRKPTALTIPRESEEAAGLLRDSVMLCNALG